MNDVDVTAFVEAELDRRHPERAQLREMQTADDYRAMWDTIERLWSETVDRAGGCPSPPDTSGSTTSGRSSRPSATWCSPPTPGRAARCSTNRCRTHGSASPTARIRRRTPRRSASTSTPRPSFDEVMAVRAGRMAVVRRIVDGLTDDELERPCTRSPRARLSRRGAHGRPLPAGRDDRGVRAPPLRRARPRRARGADARGH